MNTAVVTSTALQATLLVNIWTTQSYREYLELSKGGDAVGREIDHHP
jgi:hypothetical protein